MSARASRRRSSRTGTATPIRSARARADSSRASRAGGAFYPASGAFPASYRDQYYFADFVSKFVGRIDLANGNAAYAFASLSGAPVDLLVGSDGAVYVLTRSGVTRISAP